MKKRKLLVIGLATALASLAGTGQVAQSAQAPVSTQQTVELKGTEAKIRKHATKSVLHSGGMDIVQHDNGYGMSPKEYGIRYGNGNSRKVKHNRLRHSHNAKVKKRRGV